MRHGPPAAPLTNADAESALAALERWAADSDRPVIVLAGAAKAGKTVVLDVLASRLGRYFSFVYLSRAGSDPDEFSTRILSALGDAPDGTPRLVLAREIERRAQRPLVVLLDDADTLPPRVELWLFDLARRSAGALRLVLALSDARLAREFAAAFRADTEIVSLGASMDQAEAESYLRLVSARASDSSPAPLPRNTAGAAAVRSPQTAPATPRSERRPADAAEPLPALASIAGPTPMRVPGVRAPAAVPSAPPAPPVPAPPRVRVEAPPRAPRGDATSGAARKDPRRRWIALAAALGFSFVAGFFLSELRDAQGPEFLETVDFGAPAQLHSVSAPPAPPAPTPPEPIAAAPLPPETAAADLPTTPEAAAGSAPLVAPPDPFTRPPTPEVALPLEGRDTGGTVERASMESLRRSADPRSQEEGAPAEAPSAEEAAPFLGSEAAGNEIALAPTDGGVADASASLDFEAGAALPEAPAPSTEPPAPPPAVSAAPPAVSAALPAAPPRRPRLVRVQVQAQPGTEVRLAGRELGVAPVGSLELPPGAHRLLVRLPDGREVERIVEVRGTRYEIQVR